MHPRTPILTALLLAGCASAPGAGPEAAMSRSPADALPQTRAERTAYAETSRHADVVQFLDSLRALGAAVHLDTIGTTAEGRAIPYAVASRPLVRTPEEARRLGRPVVYVQGNIHGGEVEGKEALQMLLRDLLFEARPNVLDSVVLVAVPIYNADGNERFGPQSRQRTEQHGPEQIGLRPNAQGLDLNRDYVKAEAPETRASLRMFARWDPDVFVDLHTTNGSYHGYALTYAPSLNPAAGAAGRLTRDELLPELRRRMRARHGLESFDYGNFSRTYGAYVGTNLRHEGWFTYDHRPRFGTNYFGLRGRVAILSEAYSHDPFERRVAVTYAFVREILALSAERADALAALRSAEPLAALGGRVPLRAELTRSPFAAEVIAEELAADADSVPDEPGVHRGVRRTGRFHRLRIPVHDRFDATLERAAPAAYLLPPTETEAVRLLELHGVRVERLESPRTLPVEVFTVDSVVRAPRPFQGYHEVRLEGRWRAETRTVAAGWYRVAADGPLAVVAAYLLEPESDDGLATWSAPAETAVRRTPPIAATIAAGREWPVLRVGT